MIEKDKISEVIFDAIDELNEQLPEEQRLEKNLDTILIGEDGKIDSLGLVNLIVLIEQKIEEDFGIYISLADESDTSREGNPFDNIKNLQLHIFFLLEGENGL